jgi:hypothetical protein
VTAAEEILLETDASIFDTGDDAIVAEPDESSDGGAPAFDLGSESLTTLTDFVVGKFVSTCGRAPHNIRDTEVEIEKQGTFKRREETRRKSAGVNRGPKAVPRPTEMATNGGGVEARVDANEQNDQVFRDKIGDTLVVCSEELRLRGFPG